METIERDVMAIGLKYIPLILSFIFLEQRTSSYLCKYFAVLYHVEHHIQRNIN